MKTIALISLSILLLSTTFAQKNPEKLALRMKVDSIIRYQIGYIIDSTTNVMPTLEWDSTKKRGLYPDVSSFPSNPMPLIYMYEKGHIQSLEELEKYKLKRIKSIKVYGKNDKDAIAIYGVRAVNGAIILSRRRY